jgi:hypothetical protein
MPGAGYRVPDGSQTAHATPRVLAGRGQRVAGSRPIGPRPNHVEGLLCL